MSDVVLTNEQKKELYDILVELSYMERHCYLFRTTELYTYRQIADVMGISVSAAYQYMKRAEKKIERMRVN